MFEVVGIADDGEQTIHLVETLKPSLVLIDVAMPGLDGIAATRKMHEMSESSAVVLMTGIEGPDARALAAGAVGYVRKNHDLGPLVDIVVAFAQLHSQEEDSPGLSGGKASGGPNRRPS
jgi:DNA-binding NarL/FixJ family response regulator